MVLVDAQREKDMRKSTVAGVAVFVAILAIGFVGGVDFNERGFDQAFTLSFALVLGGAVKIMADLDKRV